MTRGQTPAESLAAIAQRDGEVNAFLTVREGAGAGNGIPLAVKDLFDTAGMRTTYGSAIYRDHVPEQTAEAVLRLEAAGFVVVGKTNLHEFAYGITSENEHFGDVRNPLDPGHIPGGSSGGSAAALAAGMCEAALGTDSAGSIRLPAACCGIVGFKPTYGAVPLDGVFPLAPSFDHVGPMARSLTGCATMMKALAPGFRSRELGSLGDVVAGIAWFEHADPLVRERLEAAAAVFPRRRAVDFPLPPDIGPAFMREVADVHRDLFAEHGELYGASVRTKVERCLRVSDPEAQAAVAARDEYRERALAALAGVDVLLTPTMASVAPPVGVGDLALREGMIRLTRPFNALGWPALALPCGPAEHGLPASLSLAGRPHDDSLVLAAGAELEARLMLA